MKDATDHFALSLANTSCTTNRTLIPLMMQKIHRCKKISRHVDRFIF